MVLVKSLGVLVVAMILVSCSIGPASEPVHEMGELTTVGPMNYTVLETEWQTQLGQSVNAAIPKDKFLLIRLSIVNSGNQQAAVPLLNLVDTHGDTHMELSQVEGVPDWLGLLRILEPAATLQGTIVFDVPAGDYQLRVTDGGDLERERTALISIPLTLRAPGVLESPGHTPGL